MGEGKNNIQINKKQKLTEKFQAEQPWKSPSQDTEN